MMFEHQIQLRVYYADTDAQGIVYHANYLRFFEAARTEYLRALGLELVHLQAKYKVQFAVVEIDVKYHKPARLDNQLNIISRISKIGRASINYQQEIYLMGSENTLLCSAEVKLVTIDMQMRPVAVPDALTREICK